jgi:hypothetical protein
MVWPDDNEVAIAQKGGVEAVVAAMGAHKGNADVQHYGCMALRTLGFNGTVGRASLCRGVRVPCGPSVCRVHVWRWWGAWLNYHCCVYTCVGDLH